MTNGAGRTVAQVRGYLVGELNRALRRSGMYGGEAVVLRYLEALAFTDEREQSWRDEFAALRPRGAFTSTGVTGGVRRALGVTSHDVLGSVYAEPAHRLGWLTLDAPLTTADHRALRRTIGSWCARDRTLGEARAEFGPESILFGGTNPRYGKTLGYGTADPAGPLVFLHFWNGAEPESGRSWPPDHPEPLLLAAREAGPVFRDEFTFTPKGDQRRRLLSG